MAIFRGFLIQGDCSIDILFDPKPLFIQLGKLVSGIDDAGCGFVFRRGNGGEILSCFLVILLYASPCL